MSWVIQHMQHFEPEVLHLLNGLKPDASATVGYEYLSGGLIWSDEIPKEGGAARAVGRSHAFKRVLAYRASLTMGKERIEFRSEWQQLEQSAPAWPGFLPDRRGAAAREILAKRIEEVKREFEDLNNSNADVG